MTPAVREMAWRCLVAIGGGAIVGLVVGGIGGRLVMLVLRLTSDGSVQGVLTDEFNFLKLKVVRNMDRQDDPNTGHLVLA